MHVFIGYSSEIHLVSREEIAAIGTGEIEGNIYRDGEVYVDPVSLLKYRESHKQPPGDA